MSAVSCVPNWCQHLSLIMKPCSSCPVNRGNQSPLHVSNVIIKPSPHASFITYSTFGLMWKVKLS